MQELNANKEAKRKQKHEIFFSENVGLKENGR